MSEIETAEKYQGQIAVLKDLLMEAETLITNLKVYHGFPDGGDCSEVLEKIRGVLGHPKVSDLKEER